MTTLRRACRTVAVPMLVTIVVISQTRLLEAQALLAASTIPAFGNVQWVDFRPPDTPRVPFREMKIDVGPIPVRPLPAPKPSGRRNSNAKKVAAGVAGGLLGMIGGGLLGAAMDRNCNCDDPGLMGFFVGAPIGGIAGAIAGVMLASR